jgi:hypothetical protein
LEIFYFLAVLLWDFLDRAGLHRKALVQARQIVCAADAAKEFLWL